MKYMPAEDAVKRIRNVQMREIERTFGMIDREGRCPYCGRYQGNIFIPAGRRYGVTLVVKTKCPKCRNEIYLPVTFRRTPQ